MIILDILQAMNERHSVRRYTDEPLRETDIEKLNSFIDKINSDSGLRFVLVTNEPKAFTGAMASYGHFSGCTNYIVAFGEKGRDEDIGYFGEKIVLYAQSIGVNSCWVALTFSKKGIPVKPQKNEKFYIVISLGYGIHQGRPHKNKPLDDLCKCNGEMPDWFKNAMDAVLTAPTAINQQKFHFELIDDNKVKAKALLGPCSKMDLGIVKYHFELGAGEYKFQWV